jgi:alpha/beta superfamily hydrolase
VRTRYPEAPLELVVIDGADHVFDGKAGEVADAIEDLLGE